MIFAHHLNMNPVFFLCVFFGLLAVFSEFSELTYFHSTRCFRLGPYLCIGKTGSHRSSGLETEQSDLRHGGTGKQSVFSQTFDPKKFLEPQTTIYKWLFQLDDSQSLHRKWLFHQTSIYKWLFWVSKGRG